MSFFDTKKIEIEVAEFFSSRYNQEHKTNYKVLKNLEENSPIDCFMYIEDSQEEIWLQMITYDKWSFSACIESTKTWKGVEIFPTWKDCIIDWIKKKSKKYDITTRAKLILLVWSSHCTYDFNTDFIKNEVKKTCGELDFKEIFCIRLPNKDNGDIIKLH